ncbi:MAG TPA: hypothetical protein VHM20_07840, partial [Gammaproteobacteria bacterium]|nr:hypothetical protein [Gammaproteobacteria bacterium]
FKCGKKKETEQANDLLAKIQEAQIIQNTIKGIEEKIPKVSKPIALTQKTEEKDNKTTRPLVFNIHLETIYSTGTQLVQAGKVENGVKLLKNLPALRGYCLLSETQLTLFENILILKIEALIQNNKILLEKKMKVTKELDDLHQYTNVLRNITPQLTTSYQLDAKIYLLEKKYDLCIEAASKAMAKVADSDALYIRAMAYYQQRKYSLALGDVTTLLEKEPDHDLCINLKEKILAEQATIPSTASTTKHVKEKKSTKKQRALLSPTPKLEISEEYVRVEKNLDAANDKIQQNILDVDIAALDTSLQSLSAEFAIFNNMTPLNKDEKALITKTLNQLCIGALDAIKKIEEKNQNQALEMCDIFINYLPKDYRSQFKKKHSAVLNKKNEAAKKNILSAIEQIHRKLDAFPNKLPDVSKLQKSEITSEIKLTSAIQSAQAIYKNYPEENLKYIKETLEKIKEYSDKKEVTSHYTKLKHRLEEIEAIHIKASAQYHDFVQDMGELLSTQFKEITDFTAKIRNVVAEHSKVSLIHASLLKKIHEQKKCEENISQHIDELNSRLTKLKQTMKQIELLNVNSVTQTIFESSMQQAQKILESKISEEYNTKLKSCQESTKGALEKIMQEFKEIKQNIGNFPADQTYFIDIKKLTTKALLAQSDISDAIYLAHGIYHTYAIEDLQYINEKLTYVEEFNELLEVKDTSFELSSVLNTQAQQFKHVHDLYENFIKELLDKISEKMDEINKLHSSIVQDIQQTEQKIMMHTHSKDLSDAQSIFEERTKNDMMRLELEFEALHKIFGALRTAAIPAAYQEKHTRNIEKFKKIPYPRDIAKLRNKSHRRLNVAVVERQIQEDRIAFLSSLMLDEKHILPMERKTLAGINKDRDRLKEIHSSITAFLETEPKTNAYDIGWMKSLEFAR